MKKTKLLSILLVAAMLFSLIAGCASETPEPSLDTSPSESAEPSETPEAEQAADTISDAPANELEQAKRKLEEEEAAEAERIAQAAQEAANEAAKNTPVKIALAAMKGPSSMGLVKLLEDNANGETVGNNVYDVTIASATDEVTSKIISGELDIVAVPSNLAAVLYNKTGGEIQTVAIGTLGVLYILESIPQGMDTEPISSLEELRGKTLYAIGQGSNPEYIINYLLREAGLEPGVDVNIEYFTAHDELVAFAATADEKVYCMLPQPNATVLTTQNSDFVYSIDLTEVWNETVADGSTIAMTAIVAQKSFIEENPVAIEEFLNSYKASIEFVNGDNKAAAELIAKFEIVGAAAIAEKALPRCNIVFIAGEDMQPKIEGYYRVLFDSDPTSVGGAVPDEGFYYIGK